MMGIRERMLRGCPHISRLRNDRRGVALLMVIWIMVLLTVMALELSFEKRVDLSIATNFRDEAQAYYLALAGMNMAFSEILSKEYYMGSSDGGGNLYFIARQATWNEAGELELDEAAPDRDGVRLGRGSFDYEIVDERRKLDIRLSSNDDRLRDLLIESGVDDLTADTITDSIKDWRDSDDLHRVNGAEDEYYEVNYEDQGMNSPYLCKNANFDSVRELLLIRGMTPEILFGSAQVEKYGFRKEEDSEGDEDEEYAGVFDLLTVWGGGLYYDTASDDLLAGLTGDARAQEEMDRRESGDWTNRQAPTHRVTSSRFTITATGRVGAADVERTVVAVVKKVGNIRQPRIEILEWLDNYVGSAYMQFGSDL
ncbi:MAG: general secretion pathway protein GspK [Candidatus Coatesbacteria bacterium]|nr:general secretion pathway protein GspK [Candidatus Coatesbacteria bacterium]